MVSVIRGSIFCFGHRCMRNMQDIPLPPAEDDDDDNIHNIIMRRKLSHIPAMRYFGFLQKLGK